MHGFEKEDLPLFYALIDLKREEKGSPLDSQEIKCVFDTLITLKTEIKTNTFNAFDSAGIPVEDSSCAE